MNARRLLLAGTALLLAGLAPAHADEQTVKLIRLLIAKGILSKSQAGELLTETAGHHAARAAPADEGVGGQAPVPVPGQIRVTYVPQFVRKQIADEVRSQVMSEAQEEGWAAPGVVPDWASKLKIYGDVRFREEADLFGRGNYSPYVNYNAINNGSPYDRQAAVLPPLLNSTENRNRLRLRARLGFTAQEDDWISTDIRLATGNDNSPISANQTLGVPGDFSKYAIWLDRAYVKLQPGYGLTAYAGRAPNPFFTSDLLFSEQLAFDGLSAHYAPDVGAGLTPFITVGGFPIFNTALDFSTFATTKYASRDAYLLAVQGGALWKINPAYTAQIGIGMFDFANVAGSVSSPCAQPATPSQITCNSDNTRAPFETFGNTLFPLREIIQQPAALTPFDPQYYGLASRFAVLDIHPRLDIQLYHPLDVSLEGDFIKNLAYNRDAILNHGPTGQVGPTALATNNLLTSCPLTNPSCGAPQIYQGGDTGYMIKATVGHLKVEKRWDWSVSAAYKYLQTDSTLDALTDSDFHLGGTNAKGYVLTGVLGIGRNTALVGHYFSTQQITGPQYNIDILQLDLQSSF